MQWSLVFNSDLRNVSVTLGTSTEYQAHFPLYPRGDNALTQPDLSVSDKLDQYVSFNSWEGTRKAAKEDVIVLESVAMRPLLRSMPCRKHQ
jgi:hypothetical protein